MSLELYTPDQVVEMLGFSKCHLWRIVKAGKLQKIYLSERKIRFTRASLDAYVASCEGVLSV